MTKLLLASVFAIASVPGYATDAVPIMGGTMIPGIYQCTDKNDNPGILYWLTYREPRCGLSPAKPKGYIPINEAVPDWFAPPQCDKFDGAEYNVCVNKEWEKHQEEPPEKPPAHVTVAPPYQGPPPIGWVYAPYTRCAVPVPVSPGCIMGVIVNVSAEGLNVRTVPNGPPVMALVNGTPLWPITQQGNWLLVAAGCDLTPTFAWSWTAGVPLNRCWVYF